MYLCNMKKEDIQELLKPLNKKELKTVIQIAEKRLNSNLGIGDKVTLTIDYMIGDADGDTEESTSFNIKSKDDLDALEIIKHILDKHTKPNEGSWGFQLGSEDFSKKSEDVYNLLYNQEEASAMFNGIKITPKILGRISKIVDEVFRDDAEYSFLVYQSYSVTQ